ncbi:ComF family protein [Candidatus Nomurabacteria bacterium]|nr:ComF family protein [Candidatus Nomurabacteria bacterium]
MKEAMTYSWWPHLSTIINYVLPARCLSCRSRNYYLCPNCRALIPKAEPLEIVDTQAVFNYQDVRIKQAIWQLKYRGARAVAYDLAQSLYKYYSESLSAWQPPQIPKPESYIVIPVPMTEKRKNERGFNQAQVLAKYFAGLDPANLQLQENILIKTRETPSQMKTRDRNTRLNNPRNAFAISESGRNQVKNRNVILIDDVITTGATISEARKVLLTTGARRVFAIAVAHG